jgi:hypothetical protein
MVALRASETAFWSPYTAQIHPRSVAHTPFQTVSLRGWVNKMVTYLLSILGAAAQEVAPPQQQQEEVALPQEVPE